MISDGTSHPEVLFEARHDQADRIFLVSMRLLGTCSRNWWPIRLGFALVPGARFLQR